MLYAVFKAGISGVLVLLVSEVAKRSPTLGGLIASIPLVSVLAFVWVWKDTGDAARIAAQSESTFWFVLPSLPMFLALPWMLRHGFQFWPALAMSCALTVALYSATAWLLPRFGIEI
jgi:hypothetical protein